MDLFEQRFVFIKPSRSASELSMLRQLLLQTRQQPGGRKEAPDYPPASPV